MNLTQLESIFQQLNSHKSSPSSWTLEQIRSFCEDVKLDWAKDILRVHQKKLNIDHLLLNNVMKQRRHNDKQPDQISILDAQKLTHEIIKDTCLANQFFYRNFNDKNVQYQIVKLKIWSFILNIYEANRVSLKRLQGLKRSRICTRGKCYRCQGQEGKCTCELLQDLLMQINCYIRSIFMAEQKNNHKRQSAIYINSNLIKLLYTNLQYLPKEAPLFWDIDEVCTLLKVLKLECLDQLFKQNMIDGFIISVLGVAPFTETSQLLKLFDFSSTQKIQNVRLSTHSRITQQQKYTYIQNVFLMLFYATNSLNQTVYNSIEFESFSNENQQIRQFDYFDLFYFKAKCLEVWKKSPDKKAQTIDNLETFKVFNLDQGRHDSIAIDAFRSNSVENKQTTHTQPIQPIFQKCKTQHSEFRERDQISRKIRDSGSTPKSQTTQCQDQVSFEQKPMQESVYFEEQQRLIQQSICFNQNEQIQQNLKQINNQELQNSIYFEPETKTIQQNVNQFQQNNQSQMQESVIFPQGMQESVIFPQTMQQSVIFPQTTQGNERIPQEMQQSVNYVQQTSMQQSIYFNPSGMQQSVNLQQQPMQGSVMLQQGQMQASVMYQPECEVAKNLQQVETGQNSVLIGQSVIMQPRKQSISIDNIVSDAEKHQNIGSQKKSLQSSKKKEEQENRTPIRQKRIRLIQSIENQTLTTILNSPFIFQLSHQMRLKSEQFNKILTVNLIGATFGRSQDNQYVLQDQSKISSKHARIIVVNDRFHLQDMGSKRGTFLNANKLRLKKGMQFYLGDKPAFLVLDINEQEGNLTLSFDKDQLDQKQIQMKLGEIWSMGRDLKRAHYRFIGYPIHQILSQIHCTISYVDKDGLKFILDDQNSKNGTWLRLSDKKLISEPEVLLKNSKFNLAFEIQYEVIDVYYNNNQ